MPELPETETIARDLHAAIAGERITDVTVTHADVLREVTPRALRARVTGTTIDRVWRRAKLVVLDLSSGDRIVVQPRFTGALLIDAGDLPPAERRYSAITFALIPNPQSPIPNPQSPTPKTDGRLLHYRDIRRLGTVALMSPARFATYSGSIGPEPLDPGFTADNLSGVLRSSRQAVKKVIMDQRHLAGIGNIYANESLWRSGIDPSRRANQVEPPRAASLRDALVGVLTEAIAARGTSFRDYRDAHGERGSFAEKLDAYGRAGLPCRRCGSRLIGTHAVDGRATVFCAHCQR
jgi:formamidopyrimidine-DNA glycosylase